MYKFLEQELQNKPTNYIKVRKNVNCWVVTYYDNLGFDMLEFTWHSLNGAMDCANQYFEENRV